MDLSSLIIGVIIMALLLVPFLIYQQKQRQVAQRRLLEFISLGSQQQVHIKQHELWSESYAIGLDPDRKKLVYRKSNDGKEQIKVIDLSEVEKCWVVSSSRENQSNVTFEEIELRFSFRNPKAPDKSLEFYNKEVNLTLNNELLLARKWNDLINGLLQTDAPTDTTVKRESKAVAGIRV